MVYFSARGSSRGELEKTFVMRCGKSAHAAAVREVLVDGHLLLYRG